MGANVLKLCFFAWLVLAVTGCGVPQNSIEAQTAREAAAANCDTKGKCVKDPNGLVLYNSDLVTENFVLKRPDQNPTLLTRLMNLIDEPKLLVTADKLEPLIRGVAIVGEFEPCDSPKGIDGANPTVGQLRSLKQGRYKACITYIGDGLFKKAFALSPIDVDTTPPEIGGGVSSGVVTHDSARLSWSASRDNLTLDGKLVYRIYTSKSNPLDTLDAVRRYGNLSPGALIGGMSYTITSLSESTNYHAAVVVTDEAGNQSLVGNSNFRTTAADTNPPISPSVVINSNASHTSTTAANLTLSAGEASEMYVTTIDGCASGGTWEPYVTSKSWTLAQTNAAATVFARFKDLAGNETACVSDTIIHDDIAPTAPNVTGATSTNDTTPSWSWTSGGGGNGTYRYKLNNADLTTGASETTDATFTASPALSEGTHILYVQERDAAGNWSESGSHAIYIDTTLPTLTISDASDNFINTSNQTSYTGITGTCSTADGSVTVTYVKTPSAPVVWSAACTSGNWTAGAIALGSFSDGIVTITATQTDSAGNVGTASTSTIKDTITPTAPNVTGATSTNDTTPSWSWTSGGGGNGAYRYKLNNADLTTGSTETTSATFTPSPDLSEGEHTLYVQERDAAGNWSESGSHTIDIDTTAPVLTINDASANLVTPVNQASYSGITGTCSTADGSVTVSFTKTPSAPVILIATCTTGSWISGAANLSAFTDGAVTITATQTDTATNSTSVSTTTTKDTAAPNAPVVSGVTPTSSTTPTWTWTSGGGGNGTYRYKLNSSDLTTGATETTSVTFTASPALSEGTHTLYVQERDAAGNWSISGSVAIEIMAVVEAPTFSVPAGQYTAPFSLTISTTTLDATIYYTTDGSDPTASSQVYLGPISIAGSTTVKSLAIKSSSFDSAIVTAVYTIGQLETLISTPAELLAVSNCVTCNYRVTANIDMTGVTFVTIQDFSGTFDGGGFLISNISIVSSEVYAGLFGRLLPGAIVKNVHVRNISITSSGISAGGIAADVVAGSLIIDSSSTGSVTLSTANTFSANVGGIAAGVAGVVLRSWSSVNVSSTGYNYCHAGGAFGFIQSTALVSDIYASGTAYASCTMGNIASGGLMGTCQGRIINSYSTGASDNLSHSHNEGGMVGFISGCSSTSSYWNTTSSGRATSRIGTGLSDVSMRTQSSFNGWDFTTVWQMSGGDGVGMPIFRSLPSLNGPTTILASSTSTTSTTLSIYAPTASHMYITNSASCSSGGVWETIASSKAWTLINSGDGTATVYARFLDGSSVSNCVSHRVSVTASALTSEGVSCSGIKSISARRMSGIYLIDPDGVGLMPAESQYCNMDYIGGGWTLITRTFANNSNITATIPSTAEYLSLTSVGSLADHKYVLGNDRQGFTNWGSLVNGKRLNPVNDFNGRLQKYTSHGGSATSRTCNWQNGSGGFVIGTTDQGACLKFRWGNNVDTTWYGASDGTQFAYFEIQGSPFNLGSDTVFSPFNLSIRNGADNDYCSILQNGTITLGHGYTCRSGILGSAAASQSDYIEVYAK